MDCAQRIQDEGASGQGSLFGGPEAASLPGARDETLPEVPAWSQRELLAFEKETLGFYLTGHPLNDHLDLVRDFATHTTAMLQEIEGRAEVALVGLVTALRKRRTKRNEPWASFLLEDLEGTCETLVFPKAWEEAHEFVRDDLAVLVRGRAEVEEERVRFIADEISPLDGLRERRAEAAILRLTTTGLEDDTLDRISEILSRRRGSLPVYLELTLPLRTSVSMQLDPDWQVTPSPELTRELQELLGPASIVYRPGPGESPATRNGERAGGWNRARGAGR
jgi:DNA polymerase-3 subunit alpha